MIYSILKYLSFEFVDYRARVFKPKKGWGGRGVKEKGGIAQSAKEKSKAVTNVVAPSVMVESRNIVGTQEENLIKADHVNMHDDNVGNTLKAPTLGMSSYANTPAGNTLGKSSYANVIGESSKKDVNICTLFTPGGTELMLLCRWGRSELLAKGL
ncbi:hypothetical protein Tco_0055275 [Tanacetum coccineum]